MEILWRFEEPTYLLQLALGFPIRSDHLGQRTTRFSGWHGHFVGDLPVRASSRRVLLGLLPRLVLVVGVLFHMELAQALGLFDEWLLLRFGQFSPSGTELKTIDFFIKIIEKSKEIGFYQKTKISNFRGNQKRRQTTIFCESICL